MLTRKAFIKASALTFFASSIGGAPMFLKRAAKAASTHNRPFKRRKTLVCIFQRGAMDGLMAVQPYDDPWLKKLRPDLYVTPTTKSNTNGVNELDGRFGLHPSLNPILPYYKDGRLAVLHGVGSPVATRSHFDAQDYMETGTPGKKGTSNGWLNRATGMLGHEGTPFQSVSMTSNRPRSLYGPAYALSIDDLDKLKFDEKKPARADKFSSAFENMYRESSDANLKKAGSVSLEAAKILEEKRITAIKPSSGVTYPNSNLAYSLKQIAQLIKAGVGLEIAFAESGGWDTHSSQAGRFGGFVRSARDLSASIAAFWQDIEPYQDDVVVMTMTEFGRTVHQNGSMGTDHGRASCMFALGNGVKGGNIYGHVPELVPENLEAGRDLPVTTDFRSFFANVAGHHLDIKEPQNLFPDWNGQLTEVMKTG